jgi:hypothetical protein
MAGLELKHNKGGVSLAGWYGPGPVLQRLPPTLRMLGLNPIEGERVPLGFCCGGFSSTAGYVSGNEVQLALNDCATTKADQFLVARPVFIRAHRKALRLSAAKPFGFSVGRQ